MDGYEIVRFVHKDQSGRLKSGRSGMTEKRYILAIDQGTSSTKAIILSPDGKSIGVSADFPVVPIFPRPGWVEYAPMKIFQSVCDAARDAVAKAAITFGEIAAIGLNNQGETVISFDRRDGMPVGNAISWQDRRTTSIVDGWKSRQLEDLVTARTGLRLDPYFSAAKFRWILDHDPRARTILADGALAMGTSDAWLIWMLTGGQAFVTDAATGSRTMLMDLETIDWCDDLLTAFGIPRQTLPKIVRCDELIGATAKSRFGHSIPITGLCVDQHAALFGHRCFQPGETKTTYGTGCFSLVNVGDQSTLRIRGLLTVLGYQLKDSVTHAVEGGVYSAGSMIEWLIALGFLRDAAELDEIAGSVGDAGGVTMIPAFNGIGAPYWVSTIRACWVGMHLGTDRRHLVRSAVDAIAFRVADIHAAVTSSGLKVDRLSVDGGLSRSRVLMQTQANLLQIPLEVPESPQVAATGVGLMAGLGSGIWTWPDGLPIQDTLRETFQPDRASLGSLRTRYDTFRNLCMDVIRLTP